MLRRKEECKIRAGLCGLNEVCLRRDHWVSLFLFFWGGGSCFLSHLYCVAILRLPNKKVYFFGTAWNSTATPSMLRMHEYNDDAQLIAQL